MELHLHSLRFGTRKNVVLEQEKEVNLEQEKEVVLEQEN